MRSALLRVFLPSWQKSLRSTGDLPQLSEKFNRPVLRLLAPVRIELHEAHVAARSGHFKMNMPALLRRGHRITARRKERIVQRVHEKGRHGDGMEKPAAAALVPVILCVLETVHRRSIAVVKTPEIPDAPVPVVIDDAGHLL